MERPRLSLILVIMTVCLSLGAAACDKGVYAPPERPFELLDSLAAAFPADYSVRWREHNGLVSSDSEVQKHPGILQGALRTHNVRTAGARASGDVFVEIGYYMFPNDDKRTSNLTQFDEGARPIRLGKYLSSEGHYDCGCRGRLDEYSGDSDRATMCYAVLKYGNYEFSIFVDYNHDDCTKPGVTSGRLIEFEPILRKLDSMIAHGLEPSRRAAR